MPLTQLALSLSQWPSHFEEKQLGQSRCETFGWGVFVAASIDHHADRRIIDAVTEEVCRMPYTHSATANNKGYKEVEAYNMSTLKQRCCSKGLINGMAKNSWQGEFKGSKRTSRPLSAVFNRHHWSSVHTLTIESIFSTGLSLAVSLFHTSMVNINMHNLHSVNGCIHGQSDSCKAN